MGRFGYWIKNNLAIHFAVITFRYGDFKILLTFLKYSKIFRLLKVIFLLKISLLISSLLSNLFYSVSYLPSIRWRTVTELFTSKRRTSLFLFCSVQTRNFFNNVIVLGNSRKISCLNFLTRTFLRLVSQNSETYLVYAFNICCNHEN